MVVTRAESPGSGLSGELERLGLPVLHWPVVGVEPADWSETQRAIDRFEWIVFTSAHAVEALPETLARPVRARIAAVGPATAEALRARGWQVDVTGPGTGAEGLLGPLAEAGVRGRRVLHPSSSRALPTLAEGLARLGAEVMRVVAYRTVPATLDIPACRSWIARHALGAVTFASPSAVIELQRALGPADFERLLAATPALAIGRTTAHAIEAHGVTPIIAANPTLRGLALACHALARGGSSAARHPNPEQQAAPRAGKRLPP